MSEEVRDAGLVAMISSILGGNKRSDSLVPALVPEVLASSQEADIAPGAETRIDSGDDGGGGAVLLAPEAAVEVAPVAEAPVEAEPQDPPAPVPMTADGKRLLPAEAIGELVLGELRKLENFPPSGVSVTVYGYRHWNAMITFAPFSTSSQHAARFRQALPDIVFRLRRFVELAI